MGASPNAASGEDKFCVLLSLLKTAQSDQNFIIINNKKFRSFL
jgi:hypothetical protein